MIGQRYDNLEHEQPRHRKKDSYLKTIRSGRQKQIKDKILHHLEEKPMTARELSEAIHCLRSSVCGALKLLCNKGKLETSGTKYDVLTERNVTLYAMKRDSLKSHEILTV